MSAEVNNVSEFAEPQDSPDHGWETMVSPADPGLNEPPAAVDLTEEHAITAPETEVPSDDLAVWRPLQLAVEPETVAEFAWIATTGSVQTYEHRVSYRFVHIDGLTGEFLDQQRNVITREAALRYARPPAVQASAPPPPEPQQAEQSREGSGATDSGATESSASENGATEGVATESGITRPGGDLAVGDFMRREDRLPRSWSGAALSDAGEVQESSPALAARVALPSKLLRMVSGVRERLRPPSGEAADQAEEGKADAGIARFTRGSFTPGGE